MVRIGIIGMGNIGVKHLESILNGKVKGAKITAICTRDAKKLEKIKRATKEIFATYTDEDEFFMSKDFDGVIICTPHYMHSNQCKKALERGYHVLCEKPIGVYTKEVEELIEVSKNSNKKFAIMYNQRTNPIYQKLKTIIDEGIIGDLRRSNWIITDSYRTQAYYDSSDWRATWGGEGGGVLLNQSSHQLDLWQWICGMPTRVRAFCKFGKGREIEVENEVTLYVEYENGATGLFMTSTVECPGTNRLEIVGNRGKIVVEEGKIRLWQLLESEEEYNSKCNEQGFDDNGRFERPKYIEKIVEVEKESLSQHIATINNWIESIENDITLLARGEEGIKGLELSNAAYLSTFKDGWVTLPIDSDEYLKELNKRTGKSSIKRKLI